MWVWTPTADAFIIESSHSLTVGPVRAKQPVHSAAQLPMKRRRSAVWFSVDPSLPS
jgi:hypothetical protein